LGYFFDEATRPLALSVNLWYNNTIMSSTRPTQYAIYIAGKQASRQAGKQASRQAGKQASKLWGALSLCQPPDSLISHFSYLFSLYFLRSERLSAQTFRPFYSPRGLIPHRSATEIFISRYVYCGTYGYGKRYVYDALKRTRQIRGTCMNSVQCGKCSIISAAIGCGNCRKKCFRRL
jgi:hypothetical protein